MDNFANTVLTTVDRFSRGLGPINMMVDRLVSRIAPQTTAKAACPPESGSVCGYSYYYCQSGACPPHGDIIEVRECCTQIRHPCAC